MGEHTGPRLTERQVEILRWIDTKPHDRSRRDWNDDLILTGPEGSITISVTDNDRLLKLVEPNPDDEGYRRKHFVLSRAGRDALARAEAGSVGTVGG